MYRKNVVCVCKICCEMLNCLFSKVVKILELFAEISHHFYKNNCINYRQQIMTTF